MRDRVVAAIAVIVLAVWLQTSVAAAASNITVSPSSANNGSTVTISGNVPVSGTASCDPTDPVQLTSTSDLFPPDGFGPQATRDASGNFQTQYVIPATTPAGTYSIGMRCGGGNVGVTATLRVAGTGAALPATGAGMLAPLTVLGVALVIFGVLLTGRRAASSETT
jgi:hypothetical protein